MRKLRPFLLGCMVAMGVGAFGCSSNSKTAAPTPDPPGTRQVAGESFDALVLDLINHQTADNNTPVDFVPLGLTETTDPHAFDSLFLH